MSMSAPLPEPQEVNHVVGYAKTIQTAVLVVAYLEQYFKGYVNGGQVRYREEQHSKFWPYEIYVKGHQHELKNSSEIVAACRGFIAGRGETWA